MEPLTEQRHVIGPRVFGFLRLVHVSRARQLALTAAITDYCLRHELTLAGVYVERCSSTPSAFAGMLDALAATGSYGVVLPTPSHLGPKAIAAERRGQLTEAGTHVLLIRREQTAPPGGSAPTLAAGGTE
ncbi:hypothetical protein P1P75_21480 [Streptomyces sp. ID05-39B]|uniref:hypothetical protein n=1 Tax=Streptomyces sp. ID05-39B TaxID=3028664 RepID=UPI0029AFD6DD|nr:hypothetical protein [Streptomyces sp. ID05-39B]MDX3528936.1 hypothetical protein [Streptomyces sp. ID05-39B]